MEQLCSVTTVCADIIIAANLMCLLADIKRRIFLKKKYISLQKKPNAQYSVASPSKKYSQEQEKAR